MKYNCDLIRDLMPLCMDDTASQTSRKAVMEHAAECADCHRIFEEMKKSNLRKHARRISGRRFS